MLVLGVGFKLDAHAAWLISTDADVTVLLYYRQILPSIEGWDNHLS